MSRPSVRFNDGAAYERGMGPWSQLVGEVFLDWLQPKSNMRWIDIGCGNGAFTELLARRCAPVELHGIDPSEAQLEFARTRTGVPKAVFLKGDSMALPFDAYRFDAAVMALVLFFVPDPVKGVAEMRRVVAPGGLVSAYLWDTFGEGGPTAPLQAELLDFGVPTWRPPSAEASRMTALLDLWIGAGLEAVETRQIVVQRRFADFEDLWQSSLAQPAVGPPVAAMAPDDVERFRAALRARLPADAQGRITYAATANAIKGRVPAAH